MEAKEALSILKQVLDLATSKGVFNNMDASYTAANAYNIIAKEIFKDDSNAAGNNGNS